MPPIQDPQLFFSGSNPSRRLLTDSFVFCKDSSPQEVELSVRNPLSINSVVGVGTGRQYAKYYKDNKDIFITNCACIEMYDFVWGKKLKIFRHSFNIRIQLRD